MQDLSHGVIRVDSEEKLSVLTLQDVGSVMPGGETSDQTLTVRVRVLLTHRIEFYPKKTCFYLSATEMFVSIQRINVCGLVSAGLMCSVKPDGVPQLCKADEIGELCVCTVATGSSYYGLTGMTKNTFEVRTLISFFGILMTYFFSIYIFIVGNVNDYFGGFLYVWFFEEGDFFSCYKMLSCQHVNFLIWN